MCIMGKDRGETKNMLNKKEDAHIKRGIKNTLIFFMHGTILMFMKFNNFGT